MGAKSDSHTVAASQVPLALAKALASSGPDPAIPHSIPRICSAAQPVVAAAVILRALGNHDRVWIFCGDPRLRERCLDEMPSWGVEPLSLPRSEIADDPTAIPDPEVTAERLHVLEQLLPDQRRPIVVLLEEDSMHDPAPLRARVQRDRIEVRTGETLDPGDLGQSLEAAGYEKVSVVAERGQYATRGGILDVFSLHGDLPLRVEFFDDEIESLRSFDPDSQRTVEKTDSGTVLFSFENDPATEIGEVADYLRKEDFVIALECSENLDATPSCSVTAAGPEEAPTEILDSPLGAFEAGDFVLQDDKRTLFLETVGRWQSKGWKLFMVFAARGEIERFAELVGDDLLGEGALLPVLGALPHGFAFPRGNIAVLSAAELFGRYQLNRARKRFGRERRQQAARAQVSYRELVDGELVVHANHGIGRFEGIVDATESGGSAGDEVLAIEYAESAKLYVPLDQAHLVSRYVGSGKAAPRLGKLGGGSWGRIREKTEKSILDYAARMLSVQADREISKGYSHPPDTQWQYEFEASFPYRETPDQLRAIRDAKEDMETDQPMDRLICGDVGFGKTEIAIRAIFKAVMGGRQVAFLAPTTVLAQQHFETLCQRYSDWPITVGCLSRFRTRAEQNRTIAGAADGSVDVVVGTHRLVSKDVSFQNLGLVIVDEEQRFGVAHKEKFKELFRLVDVLTLSATPIPRTLYLSLMGVRDLSVIETAPASRRKVTTKIASYDEKLIEKAIHFELRRGGQVFFLHNRVKTIRRMKKKLEDLSPADAVVEVGHGQMPDGELEVIMHRFVAGEIDVLVCTTIIESGIDIPNANTIFIDRADHFGLADLYQLRGRVGRSGTKAFAYLLLDQEAVVTGDARKRVDAIRQYSALGAGFQIAMRDLEIRGAGNLLGTKQSGHIAAVGFDLYCQLLRQSVARLSGKTRLARVEAVFRADFLCQSEAEWLVAGGHNELDEEMFPAFLPSSWIAEPRLRITGYRSLAEATALRETKDLRREWRDRFGPIPEAAENLVLLTEIRVLASHAKVTSVEIDGGKLILMRNGKGIQINGRYPRLENPRGPAALEETLEMVRTL